jgi:hypothetical protein
MNTGQAIVTLESNDGPTIDVPSGYIALAPIEAPVAYSRLVLSVDIGDVPDSLVLDEVMSDVKVVADGIIGAESRVTIHKLPATKVYSFDESVVFEQEREAFKVNYLSFYSAKIAADEELAALKTKTQQFNDIIIQQQQRIQHLESLLPQQ